MSKLSNINKFMKLKTMDDMANFIFALILQVNKLEKELKKLKGKK